MLKKIAYIISLYPSLSETFIAREIEGLRLQGIDIKVYSLKKSRDSGTYIYPHHRNLTQTSPFLLNKELIKANTTEIIQNPAIYISAIIWLVKHYYKRPMELLKAFVVFPKTVRFAKEIQKEHRVVHAHWATVPSAMGLVMKKLSGVPVSITAHAWDIFLSPPDELSAKIKEACGVVTCTGYNVDYLRNLGTDIPKKKICLNYHGIDFSSIPDPPA